MKLIAFQIQNFRSIIDTGWCNLSPDNITGLIGQNEAGKTAILDALYTFEKGEISSDDLRRDGTFPRVACSFKLDPGEFNGIFGDSVLPKNINKQLQKRERVNLVRIWSDKDTSRLELEEQELRQLFQKVETIEEGVKEPQDPNEESREKEEMTEEQFVESIFDYAPEFTKFEDFGSLLPDTIDLEDLQSKNESVEGYWGVRNFLEIAGLNLEDLQSDNLRFITGKIRTINDSVTADFREFWKQKIGKTNKIFIQFDLLNYHFAIEGKAGKPYLVFWINDGQEMLHPKQRSKGLRWFLSFYLRLKAGAEEEDRIFLIDEPGGSLHARAQEDMLKVFEELKDRIQVIYTTHSPYLIKLETIYRLLAVQRADETDDRSETLVLSPQKLGAASQDTLSPLYGAMGVDFSHQNVIKKNNNVILEEISAFYYLLSFWILCEASKEVQFIPATGVSNVPKFVNLFLGWGLSFGVVIDDDQMGRRTYNILKRNIFCDEESEAQKKMFKIKGCLGIEDIFSKSDFKKHILDDNTINLSVVNSVYLTKSQRPKAILAMKFLQKVNRQELRMKDLNSSTQDKIKWLVNRVESLLD